METNITLSVMTNEQHILMCCFCLLKVVLKLGGKK